MDALKAQIFKLLAIKQVDENTFSTDTVWINSGGRGVYGGQLVSQSLASAILTVDPDFYPHSLQSYFLLAGKPGSPFVFHVERIRDGRSFASRAVRVKQNGKLIFTLNCSFAKPEESTAFHQFAMPKVYAPEDTTQVLGNSQKDNHNMRIGSFIIDQNNKIMNTIDFKTKIAVPVDEKLRSNFDIGINDHLDTLKDSSASRLTKNDIRIPYNLRWMRIDNLGAEKRHKSLDLLLLACVSDYRILTTTALPHFFGYNYNQSNLGITVSLDHVLYFHSPSSADMSDWVLFEAESSFSGNGRGYVTGRFFSRKTGELIASASQEVLLRVNSIPGSIPNSRLVFDNSPPKFISSAAENNDTSETEIVASKL
ncbi:Acyl-coenzyme A thioesterase 8 [Smittium culicis]|uniref:Acyl-coenzyme A thioesterase 8 n=1 Tax=Smittium culicis TaxID=133412 RepID=A0A1R1YAE6_9FUNG|nr:Acyl-coenzyme A thioesterase 8 [Smittium culicis]